MTIAFLGSIYICYKSAWVLLIDIASMGICLIMLFDMLLQQFFCEKIHIYSRQDIIFKYFFINLQPIIPDSYIIYQPNNIIIHN